MDVDANLLSKGFIVLVDALLLVDQCLELVLECGDEVVSLIELLLGVLGVFPEG